MADWSALPNDMVVLIAGRIQFIEDFVVFRRTCSSWRVATSLMDFAMSCPRPPLLMIDKPYVFWNPKEDNEECEFFSLSKNKTCKFSFPETRGMVHCAGFKGWLIIMFGSSREMKLFHLITRVQIPLPTYPNSYTFSIAALSASPLETSEYALMIVSVSGASEYIGFWKPGNLTWTQVEVPECTSWVDDMNYYNGKFYALTSPSQIMMYDVLGPNPKKATKIMDLPWDKSRPFASLVECGGRLVVVAPYYKDHLDSREDIEMLQLDVINGTYTNITSLGNFAVFIGYEEVSFSIDASRFPGVLQPNYIYFSNGEYHPVICGYKNPIKFILSGDKRLNLISCSWVNL